MSQMLKVLRVNMDESSAVKRTLIPLPLRLVEHFRRGDIKIGRGGTNYLGVHSHAIINPQKLELSALGLH